MKNKVVARCVLLAFLVGTQRSSACSETSEPTVFFTPYGPDIPIERFLAGDLGILQPTWSRAHLVVAYRHLSGVPLTADERAAAKAYFEGRMSLGRSDGSGSEAWEDAHEKVTGSRPRVETEVEGSAYGYYVNCGNDAFVRAAATLSGYVGRYGASASETRTWVAAQDAVFSACSRRDAILPGNLPPLASAAMRSDRAYQIASAKFYVGRHEEAQEDFERIASDPDSPWRDIAPYLAARAILRQATLGTFYSASPTLYAKARAAFVAAGESAASPDVKRWCEDLIRYVDLRYDSASRIPAAAARLVDPLPGDEFGPALVHYRDLLRRVVPPHGRKTYEPAEEDDLTRWIVAFQDGQFETRRPKALDLALAGWETKRSVPWLVAILSMISPDHPSYDRIVVAARTVPRKAPGSFDVAYRLASLEVRAGRIAEARRDIAESFEWAKAEGPSATNLFLDLKLQNAETFLEFVEAAPRHPVGENAPYRDHRFDALGRDVLNRMLSLDSLSRFLDQAKLEPDSRRLFEHTVLVRAILLGRRDVARRLGDGMDPPVNFNDPEWRVEAALKILLPDRTSNPVFGLDPNYGGFWCFPPNRNASHGPPPFLREAELARAAREAAALEGAGAAGTWFCREALAFSRRHPADPRAPEFLARAVRAVRSAQSDDGTTDAARAAFRRLHSRYADTTWAKETKYWHEGRGCY